MSILEVQNVSIRYKTGDFKNIGLKEYVMRKLTRNYHVEYFWADRNVSFTLDKGEMLGIIGSNGAGKSTLLKAVSGIMEPTEGAVKRRGNIAALLELGSGFDGDLTVKENTYLRGAMLGYTRKFMDDTYDEIIRFAELENFQDRPFKQLSSGMKSRLAFAIASLVQPDILILDEVLSVGDGAFRAKSEAKMRQIISGGAATILVSHSLGQVRQMCTKVLWLEKGEQIAVGDTQILCDMYQQFLDKTITLEQVKAAQGWLNDHYDYLIVGGGMYGAAFAREMTDRGRKCLVIDERRLLGGDAACEDMNGITVHKYGPHIFHTDEKELWEYVGRFAEFVPYDGGTGQPWQGVPKGGYTRMVERMLEGVPTVTGLDYQVLMNAYPDIADKVVYTGPIDGFFAYTYGHLEYDSLRYEMETMNEKDFQGQAIVTLHDDPDGCTRVIEYKHFLREKSSGTVVAREYPQEWLPKRMNYRPVGGERNEKLLRKYMDLAKERPDVIFGGRLGEYRPYTMAEAIAAARARAAEE